jgi:bifunctional autolysin
MANTSSNVDDHQLVLNGSMQGNSLTFPAPSSRLTTQFFLALNGEITMNDRQGNNLISNATMNSNGSNASYTPLANTTPTPTQNSIPSMTNTTLAQSSTLPQNQIGPSVNNVTKVAIQALNNVTTSQLTNQSLSSTQSAQELVTVTVTQPQYNRTMTVYVTQTVADSTITQTVTGTESNVTITQSNVTTTTVANATITVTNSTATTSSTP